MNKYPKRKIKYNNFEIIYDPTGAYVLVELKRGYWSKCDINDWFGNLDQYCWNVSHCPDSMNYCTTSSGNVVGNCRRTLRMHRLVMDVVGKSHILVDHINRDPLDNRRFNLRLDLSNGSNNNKNKSMMKNNTTGYVGLVLIPATYHCIITVSEKKIYLGRFPYTPEGLIQAAKAYDIGSLKYHGDWGVLNFPELREEYLKQIVDEDKKVS